MSTMTPSIAARIPNLSDVPEVEENLLSESPSASVSNLSETSPYGTGVGSPSASTVAFSVPTIQTPDDSGGGALAAGGISRKPSSTRTLGRSSTSSEVVATGSNAPASPGGSGSTPIQSSIKRKTSVSSTNTFAGGSGTREGKHSSRPTKSASTTTLGAAAASTTSPAMPSQSPNPNLQPPHTLPRYRSNPRLPHDKETQRVPATMMYWSRAPVWGHLPTRTMRAHSVTLVDNVAWLFGGCDDKDCWKDLYLFDTETMEFTHPDMTGDCPPPCRAHTATLVDRKMYVFGGGQDASYSNSTYILDVNTRRWARLPSPPKPTKSPTDGKKPASTSKSGSQTPKELSDTKSDAGKSSTPSVPNVSAGLELDNHRIPAPRRAHTAVFYAGRVWVFGGGNGMTALNDVWTLDVSSGLPGDATGSHGSGSGSGSSKSGAMNFSRMRWEEVPTSEPKPSPRGYHTANLVGNMMIIVGGSDGKECFSDIWCLNLGECGCTLSFGYLTKEML
ncbi:hypothetical protein HGRIS_002964 [Hohenbuehelia grisea]|uniref:Galactose oxidase n=1 Tax=Hohenbuehelia grisea TaxID=104357 RepID=A0ABR3JMT1_9AGAR